MNCWKTFYVVFHLELAGNARSYFAISSSIASPVQTTHFVNVLLESKYLGGLLTMTPLKTRWSGFALPMSERDWPSIIRRRANLSNGKLRFQRGHIKRSSSR